MIQKILLCADGSGPSASAVRLCAVLAKRLGAQVDIVNAVDPIIATDLAPNGPETGLSEATVLQSAQVNQQSVLRSAGEVLDAAGITYRTHSEFGNPVELVCQAAIREHSDLIVTGSRGHSAFSTLLLGSVSEGIVRHGPCPVLVVRGEPDELHRIVVATDGSAYSDRVVRAGMELAKVFQAEVSVLNVFEPDATYEGVAPDPDPVTYATLVQEAIELQVELVAKGNGVEYKLHQEQGHPAETLVGFAEMEKTDVIVVGAGGASGLQQTLTGSVATSVLHHAHCSVLVVR
jgi:nucleotide-binding universal stress UspA family protein